VGIVLVRPPARLLAVGAALALLGAPARADDCSDEEAEAAEAALGEVIDQLKESPGGRGSWEKLDVAVRRYKACDEYELSPLFSEAVCLQLADGWRDAPAMVLTNKRAPEVLPFVLSHLDNTCAPERLDKILGQVARRCPRYGKSLCEAIRKRAEAVLADHPARQKHE
jgi:hypothetical protein